MAERPLKRTGGGGLIPAPKRQKTGAIKILHKKHEDGDSPPPPISFPHCKRPSVYCPLEQIKFVSFRTRLALLLF